MLVLVSRRPLGFGRAHHDILSQMVFYFRVQQTFDFLRSSYCWFRLCSTTELLFLIPQPEFV